MDCIDRHVAVEPAMREKRLKGYSVVGEAPAWTRRARGGTMDETPRDDEREERITMEIIVDAYGPEEQALGWYYYLDDKLQFPFTARCITRRAISPLQVGDEIDVVGMAPEEECEREMFVLTRWERGTLGVPLSQLEGVAPDAQSQEAIQDWHYWVGRGYEF